MKEGLKRGMGTFLVGATLLGGPGIASADSLKNTDSVVGGDKDTILKDSSLSIANRHDANFAKLGMLASVDKVATVEQTKSTAYEGLIFKIGDSNYLAFTDISGGNNISKKIDTCPVIENGRTMLPLRAACEALGAKVNYDNETQEIDITKDNKKIEFQIGNSIMEVNENKSTLDVSPYIDKNDRTLVPLRAIAEGFGKTVLWDEATNTVFIGFNDAQKNNYLNSITTKTEVSPDVTNVNVSEVVSKFMANENTDISDQPFSVVDEKSGIVVTFSNKAFKIIDGEINQDERKTLSAEKLQQDYVKKSPVEINRDKLKSKGCKLAFIDVDENNNIVIYNFTDENLKPENTTIIKVDINGQETTLTYTPKGSCYWGHFSIDPDKGVCISSNNRIIAEVIGGKGVVNLSNNELLGTEQQRINNNLKNMCDGVINGQTNPFNLNINEVNQYLETGSDEGLTSFQVVKSQETSFIMVTGGQWGLNELFTKSVEAAVKRWDEIDPNIMKEIVETNGLEVVTFDRQSDSIFQKHSGAAASYSNDKSVGVVYLNQDLYTRYLNEYSMNDLVKILCTSEMELILVESRGIYDMNHKSLNNTKEIEVSKNTYLLEKTEQYKSELTYTEYHSLKQDAENSILLGN